MTSCSFNEPILKSGDSGNAVNLLQTSLHGYFVIFGAPTVTDPGSIDGDFGPLTEASLKSFQSSFVPGSGPTPDGITGPITWSWLDQSDRKFPISLVKGASGNPVRWLQRILFAAGSDPGGVDGIYGNQTAAAVEEFQKTEGLPPTGNADGQTGIQLGFVFPF